MATDDRRGATPWGEDFSDLAVAVLDDRAAPPVLTLAAFLYQRGAESQLKDRRACLTGARDDFDAIEHATVEDGGIWIRAVAQRRKELVESAISETDKALVALGSFDLCV